MERTLPLIISNVKYILSNVFRYLAMLSRATLV